MPVMLKCQLENDGKCSTCSNLAADETIIECTRCKLLFHAVCPMLENEICNKSFFKIYSAKSTKRNFMWFCDACLTSFEFDSASNDTARITNLERQLNSMDTKFKEIKELIVSTTSSSKKPTDSPTTEHTNEGDMNQQRDATRGKTKDSLANYNVNPWKVQSRVTILKDNLGNVPDLATFEKKALNKNLKVKKATRDTQGNIVLVCPSTQDAIAVRQQATLEFPQNTVLEPRSSSSVINIVGFRTDHDVETLCNLLINANPALSSLKDKPLDEIKMFFDIVAVKPCARNSSVFRAVVRVSKTLRHMIRLSNNKLKIGFYICSVYDRTIAKRCNKCQTFGHWADDCKAVNNILVCAHCGGNHDTRGCKSDTFHCVNCAKVDGADCNHSANSINCPAYIAYRDSLQNSNTTEQNGTTNFLV